MKKRLRKLLKQLKTNYKLVVLNHDTFEEQISLKINLLNIFVAVGMSAILLISLSTTLVVFTPLREYIPGYADVSLKKNVADAAFKADSLTTVLKAHEAYLANIKSIVDGKSTSPIADSVTQISKSNVDLDKKFPNEVEELRENFEENSTENVKISSIGDFKFTKPTEGRVVHRYNIKESKPAQIIQTAPNALIKAVYDGLVLYSGFTNESGYMLVVQHAANVVSVYKNCASGYKKQGNYVKVGEAIAVAGDKTKDNGPQLAFELWHNGVSVDPNEYLKF